MPKKSLFYFAFFSFCILFLASCKTFDAQNSVCFKKSCFEVEVVRHQEELSRGLQNRMVLDPDKGMLFVFSSNAKHSFWMKDTFIPLDMIWMDYARRVVYIVYDVKPCVADPCETYTPIKDALYVLEINAHKAKETALNLGDIAEFKISP